MFIFLASDDEMGNIISFQNHQLYSTCSGSTCSLVVHVLRAVGIMF